LQRHPDYGIPQTIGGNIKHFLFETSGGVRSVVKNAIALFPTLLIAEKDVK
jgi:hypothetical protein